MRRATGDLYACTVDDKLAMKIGFGEWSPNRDPSVKLDVPHWKCTVSGVNFAVWIDERAAQAEQRERVARSVARQSHPRLVLRAGTAL